MNKMESKIKFSKKMINNSLYKIIIKLMKKKIIKNNNLKSLFQLKKNKNDGWNLDN